MPTRDRAPGGCQHWGTIIVFDPARAVVATVALDGYGQPDIGSVDELARLELIVRRLGGSIEVRDTCTDLSDLIELAGLTGVLVDRLSESVGQTERGEQGGVEEVVVPDDPVA